jgi:hypothetical protein
MIYEFPAEFFFWTTVENHQKHKEKYVPMFREQMEKAHRADLNGSGLTTHGENNFSYFDQEFVENVIWKPYHQMLSEYKMPNFTITDSSVSTIWWNHYEPGEYCAPHRHYRADFTGIYILEMDEPNTTCFMPSNNSSNTFPIFDGIQRSKEVKEGDVLIFPGRLLHWTNPCQKERWTVIFDLNAKVKEIIK